MSTGPKGLPWVLMVNRVGLTKSVRKKFVRFPAGKMCASLVCGVCIAISLSHCCFCSRVEKLLLSSWRSFTLVHSEFTFVRSPYLQALTYILRKTFLLPEHINTHIYLLEQKVPSISVEFAFSYLSKHEQVDAKRSKKILYLRKFLK